MLQRTRFVQTAKKSTICGAWKWARSHITWKRFEGNLEIIQRKRFAKSSIQSYESKHQISWSTEVRYRDQRKNKPHNLKILKSKKQEEKLRGKERLINFLIFSIANYEMKKYENTKIQIQSEPTKIKLVTTNRCIACILFQCWSGPSTELIQRVVIKRLFAIVASVPERIWAENCAYVFAAKDFVPHVRTGVDSDGPSSGFKGLNQFLNEIAVWCCVTDFPWATSTGVGFDVEPYHSCLVFKGRFCGLCFERVKKIDKLIGLHGGIFTSAWEHVHISGQSCSVWKFDIVGSIKVNGTVTMICTDDGSIIALLLKAGIIAKYTCKVNNVGSIRSGQKQSQENEAFGFDTHPRYELLLWAIE